VSPISPTVVARFAGLPKMAGEVWQGGLIRLPVWVEDPPGAKPYRPWAAFWASLRTGRLHQKIQPVGYLSVLGGGGQVFGLGFYERPDELDALLGASDPTTVLGSQDRWSLQYGSVSDLSFGDADLWEDHDLPVAGDEGYPLAVRLGPGGAVRPDAKALAYLEGLLLALAETSEDEMDRGRWSRQVPTQDGLMTFRLCIPVLVEPLDAPAPKRTGIPDRRAMERVMAEVERFMADSDFADPDEANEAIRRRFIGSLEEVPSTATTPLEKAQELMYHAFDARGRRRVHLARKALELSLDCADAYVVLAEETSDPAVARDLYAQGVAAGERALGVKTFEEDVGHFWGMITTRPYMRARLGFAQCLEQLGHVDDAVGHYRELLRLNPNDNQGVRDILLPTLLATGRDEEAGALLERYADDVSATWKYGWALWAFRREGDSPAARGRLREALRANRHVPKCLAGKADWPEILPDSYAFGSLEEAVICADELGEAWRSTPGAERWLMAQRPKKKPGARRRR